MKGETERVDELTEPPVVGRFYLVPCVRGVWAGILGRWPVWGPKHEDEKFLHFPERHYHLDRRFIQKQHVDNASGQPLTEKNGLRGYDENKTLPAPEYRRLKCQRIGTSTAFPTQRALERTTFQDLYQHFSGHQCAKDGAGWICPHKGMRLATISVRSDGNIQCPLHGLLIDAETGVVVQNSLTLRQMPERG